MGLRKAHPPTPAPMTLVANTQHEALLLLLLEAYPREPVTDRRLAAYLPRVAPFSDDEVEAAVNCWLDDPEHVQAPAPGQLKDLLERRRQWATPATDASASADLPSWRQPPPPEEDCPSSEELRELLRTFVWHHTMPSPPQTARPRRPLGAVETRVERSGEVDSTAVELLGKAIRAVQYRQLAPETLGVLKQRLREATSLAELTAIAAEIPDVMAVLA